LIDDWRILSNKEWIDWGDGGDEVEERSMISDLNIFLKNKWLNKREEKVKSIIISDFSSSKSKHNQKIKEILSFHKIIIKNWMAINKRDNGEILSSWLWFKFGWEFWEDEEEDEWDGRGNDKWDKQMVGWIIDKSKGIFHYIFYFIEKENYY